MRYKLIIALTISVLLSSCGTQKKYISSSKSKRGNSSIVKGDIAKHIAKIEAFSSDKNSILYLKKYANMAVKEMSLFKIPASITLAQGIVESNAGRSTLAVKANNHFGIKCHKWEGEKIYHDDDEKGECFRKYDHART